MTKRAKRHIRSRGLLTATLGLVTAMSVAYFAPAATAAISAHAAFTIAPSHVAGNLDCNGFSPIQRTIIPPGACTDVRGTSPNSADTVNTDEHHFSDNGHYIGHDEPDMTFFSSKKGSGNNVSWSESLPKEPTALPTVATPGSDITHTFELSVAPWFGMALCDGNSYPQLPCTPNSDKNAPACFGPKCGQATYSGAGSSFLEMQFYPPGDAPFVDSISCTNTSWCASLHINELECTFGFVSCNPNCEETTNFAFVQKDGTPTGPPSPQLGNQATATPNANTLLMNPGDKLKIRIYDAPAPAVPAYSIPAGHALTVSINDLTTHQTGYMQASAFNGFTQTDISSCGGRYFNYEPEYSTSAPRNVVPWAALQANISTEFEIGHFTPCSSVTGNAGTGAGGVGDPVYLNCVGPYETSTDTAETADVPCFTAGDTHGTLASDPNQVTGCLNFAGGGDIDFDGSSYRTGWPTSASINQATSHTPSSFLQSMPTSGGHAYSSFLFQTDTALSEAACTSSGAGCTIPPTGTYVDQPGNTSFFPFWSIATKHGTCTIEFGNVTSGVNTYGRDAQYGKAQVKKLGYPEFEGSLHKNTCKH